MRFNVHPRTVRWSAVLVLTVFSYIEAAAQKTCECGDPSIGTVSCEQNLEPYCLVDGSKIKAGCKSPGGRNGKELQRFMIEQALGRSLTEVEWKSPEVQNGIKDGALQVRNADGKIVWISVRSPKGDGPLNDKTPFRNPEPSGGGAVAGANTEIECEVCRNDVLGTHCKNVKSAKEADIKAAVAELCGSDAQCLARKPKVTCKRPSLRRP